MSVESGKPGEPEATFNNAPQLATETIASPEIVRDRPKAVVVLWRHEQSQANADKSRIQGFNPSVPLSEHGHKRAAGSGAPGLRAFLDGNNLEVVAARTSSADRAKQTASAVLEGARVEVALTEDSRLNEQGKGHADLGGVEGMERRLVETPAYKAREKLEDWDFRPGVGDQPGVAESGAETPGEAAARWQAWRDELADQIEDGALPPTHDPNKIPAVLVFGHNLITAYGMGSERDMSVAESKGLYRVDNGEALVLGWDGQAWNLEGQLYRPSEAVA